MRCIHWGWGRKGVSVLVHHYVAVVVTDGQAHTAAHYNDTYHVLYVIHLHFGDDRTDSVLNRKKSMTDTTAVPRRRALLYTLLCA